MAKSLKNKRNKKRKLSIKNNYVGGVPPNYIYLIYTEAQCSEGIYLYHVRYLGYNLKEVLKYYHSMFTRYRNLSARTNAESYIAQDYINKCIGYSEIGRHYIFQPGQSEWLQDPLDIHSTESIINSFNFKNIYRRNAIDHLVRTNLNGSAYDGEFPHLVKLDISAGSITRDQFYHGDSVSDERVSNENTLEYLVENDGTVPMSTYQLIDRMNVVGSKVTKLDFLDDLGMFTSNPHRHNDQLPFVRDVVNKRYPKARELNRILVQTYELENAVLTQLLAGSYTFNIPTQGLDVSHLNIVLSEGYFEIFPNEIAPLDIRALNNVLFIVNRAHII